MKGLKITALILTAAIGATALTACNKEKKPVSSGINIISSQNQGMGGDAVATIDPNALSGNYVFKYNGTSVTVNIDAKTVIDKLGDFAYDEKPWCAGQGVSKYYTYNGGSIVITTAPMIKEKMDAVYTITLNDDSVSTAEGIFVGNTAEQVKAAYGTPALDNGTTLQYEKGSSQLAFIMGEDGKIMYIIYQSKAIV